MHGLNDWLDMSKWYWGWEMTWPQMQHWEVRCLSSQFLSIWMLQCGYNCGWFGASCNLAVCKDTNLTALLGLVHLADKLSWKGKLVWTAIWCLSCLKCPFLILLLKWHTFKKEKMSTEWSRPWCLKHLWVVALIVMAHHSPWC